MSFLNAPQELVMDGPPRKSDGTLDEDDIVLFGVEISLLELRSDLAFFGANETRGHLDARGARLKHPGDVRSR